MSKKKVPTQGVAAENDNRLRILYLYHLLLTQTDEDHTMTTQQIIQKMEDLHGIRMHRTTVPTDIALLQAAGFHIEAVRKQAWHYYLSDRTFSIPELRILIDAVQSSKFITDKKSRTLIEKLISLASETNADKLRRTCHTAGRPKSENEKGYHIVDAVNEAIVSGVKISFRYFDYDEKKQIVLKNDGKPYTVSPYDLLWDGDFYYLVGFCDERKGVRTFRADRILKVPKLLKKKSVPQPKEYSVTKYTQHVFRMFDGQECVNVELLCKNAAMKYIIDRFGKDVSTETVDEDHFMVHAQVCTGPTFYRWLFGFSESIRLVGPKEAKKEYKEMLEQAIKRI